MKGTPTTTVRFENSKDATTYRADDSDELREFASDLSEGDYVTVVYPTPSNGGSLHRCMGTVDDVETLDGRLDGLRFDVDECDNDSAGSRAYLHVNPETGDYYFTDGSDDLPADGWEVQRLAWTPE